MTAQNYYTSSDTPDYEFCKTPKALFKSETLKKLSDGAKLLYIAILNRLTLSIKNGLEDEQGRTIVYYSIEDVCEELGCSRSKAVRLFAELDIKKGAGLIDRKRLGLCKTSIIFVLKPEFEKETKDKKETRKHSTKTQNDSYPQPMENVKNPQCEDVFFDSDSIVETPEDSKEDPRRYEIDTSGISNTENQEASQSERNKNNINNNKLNNNNLNKHKINLSINSQNSIKNTDELNFSDGWKDRAEEYKKIIQKNISYDTLIYSVRKEWLDEIVSVMTDVLCLGACVKINKIVYPYEAVKERLLSLESDHIEYVWECIKSKSESEPIKNIRPYIITSLYRAPETMISWYEARVRSEGV